MRRFVTFLLCLWAARAADQRVDCQPFRANDTDKGPWDATRELHVGPRWEAVRTKCERVVGCVWDNTGYPDYAGGADDQTPPEDVPLNAPRCYYGPTHLWEAGEEWSFAQLSYQDVVRDNANVSERFPGYRDKYTDYPALIDKVRILFDRESHYRLRVKIEDPATKRFEIPHPWRVAPPRGFVTPVEDLYTVTTAAKDAAWWWKIQRKGGSYIWDTENMPGFHYEDQFLQLTTKLSSDNIYGFGEHEHMTLKHDFSEYSRFAMFTHSHVPRPGPALYGHHPFFMGLDRVGSEWQAYGMFWLNSNGQEIEKIVADSDGRPAMTLRAIGGIFDFYFFFGPTPALVVSQYQEAIGRPYLVPYWSLGFHMSQYEWSNLTTVQEMYDRMIAAEIPWDTIHHDIDYMKSQRDFTVDDVNYAGLKEWDLDIQSKGMHVVIMLDPAISYAHKEEYNGQPGFNTDWGHGDPYPSADSAFDLDLWVMIEKPPAKGSSPSAETEYTPMEGIVWPDWPQVDANAVEGTDFFEHIWKQLVENQNSEDLGDWEKDRIAEVLENFPKEPDHHRNAHRLCHYHLHSLWHFQIRLCRSRLGFPDFWQDTARLWWKTHLIQFREELPFDAIWIDMNEPETFVHGSYTWREDGWEDDYMFEGGGCPDNRWNFPPHKLLEERYQNHHMWYKTLCFSCLHKINGVDELHYNLHSIYGSNFAIPTWEAVREVTGLRSFVFSRSTFPGVGKYIGHWLGDNAAWWDSMKYSIIGQMEFNWFGIPYVGADVCGHDFNAYDQLCMRWTQLGAFYGNWRNHNTKWARFQDPANWGPVFAATAKRVHETRYSLLPYIYTAFSDASRFGRTVARSMMEEFVNQDSNAKILTLDEQFLFGPALLVAPAVHATPIPDPLPPGWDGDWNERDHLRDAIPDVDVYLPGGEVWYDFYTGHKWNTTEAGQDVQLHIPLYNNETYTGDRHEMPDIGLFVRGGRVLPMQGPANTTVYARRNPMGALVALGNNNTAFGRLFWDDGDSQETIEQSNYGSVVYGAIYIDGEYQVQLDYAKLHPTIGNLTVGNITVYGVEDRKAGVAVFGGILFDKSMHIVPHSHEGTVLNIFPEAFELPFQPLLFAYGGYSAAATRMVGWAVMAAAAGVYF